MSNNKNLLKEGTIRRFMKLAGTDVLSSGFLAEGGPGKWGASQLKVGNHEGKVSPLLAEEEEESDSEVIEEVEGEELEDATAEEEVTDEIPEDPMGDAELELDDEEEEEVVKGSVEDFAKDALDALSAVAADHGVDIVQGAIDLARENQQGQEGPLRSSLDIL